MTVNGQSRSLSINSGIAWDAGHVADQSFKAQPGEALEIADAGDFDKNQPFTAAAWVKLDARAANSAPSSRGWTISTISAAGICGSQNGQVGCHIINPWDNDAIKVLSNRAVNPNEWNHVMVTYDGSGKAEGVKIYINGEPQPTHVMVNKLKNTTRTKVPFKIAQRNTTSRLDDALIQDVRIYNRSLSAPEATQLAKATRAVWLAAMSAAKRSKAETDELFAWWLVTEDKAIAGIGRPVGQPQFSAGRHHGSRHGGPRDARAQRTGDGLRVVSRRIRQAPRGGEGRHAGDAAADAGRVSEESPRTWRSGWCGRRIR